MRPANRQKMRPVNQFWWREQHERHRKLDRTCKESSQGLEGTNMADWIECSERRLKSLTDLNLSSSSLLFQDTSCLLLETLIKFRKKRVGVGEMDMQVIIIMFISQYHYRRSDDLWLKVLFWEASESGGRGGFFVGLDAHIIGSSLIFRMFGKIILGMARSLSGGELQRGEGNKSCQKAI